MKLSFHTVTLLLFSCLAGVATPGQQEAVAQDRHRIVEIILEAKEGQTGNFDPYGPGFRISIHRDGESTFFGKAKVKLLGDYHGTISKSEFGRLVKFIVSRNYERIPDDPVNAYRINSPAGATRATVYDEYSPWMFITVRHASGDSKQISRPTDLQPVDRKQMPKALFEIEQAIFDKAAHIVWKKKN